jgi:hypothetical protein
MRTLPLFSPIFRHILSHTEELNVYNVKIAAVHHSVHLTLHFPRMPIDNLKRLGKREIQQAIPVSLQLAELNRFDLIAVFPQMAGVTGFLR